MQIETWCSKISENEIRECLIKAPPTTWDDFSLDCMEEQCKFDLAYEKAKVEYDKEVNDE